MTNGDRRLRNGSAVSDGMRYRHDDVDLNDLKCENLHISITLMP
jgi:hypothetical protein